MKFLKTKNQYKASNVLLDLNNEIATSYDWWIFLKRINGKLVFNNYRYSPSTEGHQRKILKQLDQLGIKVDMFIESPKGLQDLNSAISYYEYEISELVNDIATTNRRKITRQNQIELIQNYQAKIKNIKKILPKNKLEIIKQTIEEMK